MAFTGGTQSYFPFAPGIGAVVTPGAVTSVTATLPIISSGGTTPNISLQIPLPIVDGGTGTATPTLVAGTNVTITGIWPDQTINATAGGGGVASVTASSPLASTGGSNPNISITSPLPIANGGTGTATPNLIAGAGINITGTWPNETIIATATPGVTSVTGSGNILSSGGGTPNITTVNSPTFSGTVAANVLTTTANASIGTALTVGTTIAAGSNITPGFGGTSGTATIYSGTGVPSFPANEGSIFLSDDGDIYINSVGGTVPPAVTAVTGSGNIISSGGTTPAISITATPSFSTLNVSTTGVFGSVTSNATTATAGAVPPVYFTNGTATGLTEHIVRGTATIGILMGDVGRGTTIALSGAAVFSSISSYQVVASYQSTGSTLPSGWSSQGFICAFSTRNSGSSITIFAGAQTAATSTGTIAVDWMAIGL